MLDNLNDAYNAYQTALYHLQNLRVRVVLYYFALLTVTSAKCYVTCSNMRLGAEAVVWYWHSLRQIWLA
jgi:heme/copper-type cytochrome/quinol oxidase subunit 3